MTTDARRVIGIIDDVRMRRSLGPLFRRHRVTSPALCLVFLCCVGELGIIDALPEGNTEERDQDD